MIRIVLLGAFLVFAARTAPAEPPAPSTTPLTAAQQSALMAAVGFNKKGDYDKAIPIFEELAALGNARAQSDLGEMYYCGCGMTPNDDRAFDLETKAIAQGYGGGENNLGEMYRDMGFYNKALQLFRQAAQQGNPEGQVNLGYMYEKAQGVPYDPQLALHWYLIAAKAGDAQAQSNAGDFYHFGIGTPVDNQKASVFLEQAAAQGNADGEMHLGVFYRDGIDVDKNPVEAVELFQAAADQGQQDAEDLLADSFRLGIGTTQDYVQAANYYALAAQRGDPDAQVDLGYAYEIGQGVPQNFGADLKWALITKSLLAYSSPDSTFSRDVIEHLTSLHMGIDLAHLKPADVVAARTAAAFWLGRRGLPEIPMPQKPRPGWEYYAVAIAGILIVYASAKFMSDRRTMSQ